jgi:hypothetical protein
MSVDLYPAKLTVLSPGDEHTAGSYEWTSVVPMRGDSERLRKEARYNEDFEGSAFEPDPEYFPFSSLNMTTGNLDGILRLIRVNADWTDSSGKMEINEAFKKAHDFLFSGDRTRDMEQYVAERVFAIREMARLGITRGATHIVWA